MKQKLLFTLLFAAFSALSINSLEAQTKEKSKIVIKKKITDKDGNVTETIEELEGEDADVYILEQEGGEGEEIELEVEIENGEENEEK